MKKIIEPRNCKVCLRQFVPKRLNNHSKGLFCSLECVKLRYKRESVCKNCGLIFSPKKVGGAHKGHYCSKQCFITNYKKICDENRKFVNCVQCGKTVFYVGYKDIPKFCSKICFGKYEIGENNPYFKEKIIKKCKVCLKEIQCIPSRIYETCGKECHIKLKSGETNKNYKGGKFEKCEVCENEFWKCPGRSTKFCSRKCFHKLRFGTGGHLTNRKFGMMHCKSGKREDIGIFVRSSWEANYARYLNFLIKNKQIKSWRYEKKTFEFEKIKKGTKFYTPDFEVILLNDEIEYHEVKGWMHPKGATALKRMKIYYPKIKIVLIQKKEYEEIKSKIARLIPNWE